MARTGPGPAHRKGLALSELLNRRPDADSAERWFAAIFRPAGMRWPACGSGNLQARPASIAGQGAEPGAPASAPP